MQLTTPAIVLSALKYGDTSLIVKALTASNGIKSYLVKGVLGSKKGKLKAAYFQPLTQLEMEVYHKNKGTLESIREAKIGYPYYSLQTDVIKNAIGLFCAEMLVHSITEEERDPGLFRFIEAALQWLDVHDQVANFHLYFLLELSRYLGFYPDTSEMEAPYFDLVEGSFVSIQTMNPLVADENLTHFKRLLGTNFDAMETISMNKENRQELLKTLILYFDLHLQGFRHPKSLAILNQVFR